MVEKEFVVDRANSVDKRSLLDPDRFGYLSLHYVVTMTHERARLLEYKQFAGIKMEIQVRSILQHAWAEIEHDLGYRTRSAIPAGLRRRFSRLAGLLEIADSEFESLREDVGSYQERVDQEIEHRPDELAIDRDTIAAYVRTSDVVANVDCFILEHGVGEQVTPISGSYASARARSSLASVSRRSVISIAS